MYRRIRDLREDRDLLQKDLAAYLQCSQVCYSYYEMGKRDIPTDVLLRLADFYATSTPCKSPCHCEGAPRPWQSAPPSLKMKPIKAAFYKAAFIGLRIERKSNSCKELLWTYYTP